MAKHQIILLNSGGLRSLVATATAAMQYESTSIVLMHLREPRGAGKLRAYYTKQQASHYGIDKVIDLILPTPATLPQMMPADGGKDLLLMRPQILLAAFAQTVRLKIDKLIWPIQFDNDQDAIARVLEQSVLIRHIVQLENPTLPQLDMPQLNLSNKQLIELGNQLNVPWRLAWSCYQMGEAPCGGCQGCKNRKKAFDTANILDLN